jgi:hypothetical protein
MKPKTLVIDDELPWQRILGRIGEVTWRANNAQSVRND